MKSPLDVLAPVARSVFKGQAPRERTLRMGLPKTSRPVSKTSFLFLPALEALLLPDTNGEPVLTFSASSELENQLPRANGRRMTISGEVPITAGNRFRQIVGCRTRQRNTTSGP